MIAEVGLARTDDGPGTESEDTSDTDPCRMHTRGVLSGIHLSTNLIPKTHPKRLPDEYLSQRFRSGMATA